VLSGSANFSARRTVARKQIAKTGLAFRDAPWQRMRLEQSANASTDRREGGRERRLWATLMQPVVVATDAMLVVGIRGRTTHRIEAVGQTAKIPALWRRFFVDNVASQIPGLLPDPAVIAVYSDYENADWGQYSLLIGRKVQSLDHLPKRIFGELVPAGPYLCFTVDGPSREAPNAAWLEIRKFFERSHEYERAYTTDFEVHGDDQVSIYVAMK
jgi:predicted transcriptional regulator YdeE